MFRALTNVLLISMGTSLALAACDSAEPDTDAGGADAGEVDAGTADSGGVFETRTVSGRFVDSLTGAAIEGVHAAVDTDRGRFEASSGADGTLSLEIEYTVDEFDVITAHESYRIVAFLGQTVADLPDADIELTPLSQPVDGEDIQVELSATGVPTGGRWCVAFARYVTTCHETAVAISRVANRSFVEAQGTDHVNAYAFDAGGALVDFVSADWTIEANGDQSLVVDFDGAFASDMSPTTRAVTMALPEGATSPFRTATLDADWQGWVVGVEPGNYLSRTAITDFEVSGATATFNLHVFDLPAGELLYAIAAYADFVQPIRTFTWFSADPGNELSLFDVPTVETASTFHGEVAWPAPADDVDDYVVSYNVALGNIAVLVTREPRAVMPPLPSAYDDTVSFPFPDGAGYVQVIARRGDLPPDDGASDPYAVDGTAATGPRRAITF